MTSVPTEGLISVPSQTWGCGVERASGGCLDPGRGRVLSCVSSPTGTVCADHHPDQLRGHLAVRLPSWLVVFPDWIHDFSDCPLHKLLYSGKSHSSVTVEIGGPWSQGPHSFLMGSPCRGGAGVGVTANVGGGTEVCPGLWSSRSSMREARGPCGKAELSRGPRTASLVATADPP